jgi:hypothetical protein
MPTARPCLRRQHDFRAQEAHELASLHAELLRHRHDQRVTLLGAHHREPDPGVAAGRFDDGLSRLQLPRAFRRFDDAQRQSILDRTQGIECFDLA